MLKKIVIIEREIIIIKLAMYPEKLMPITFVLRWYNAAKFNPFEDTTSIRRYITK